MQHSLLALMALICVNCLGQETRIEYRDWDGEMCLLSSYELTEKELILHIVPDESKDTLELIIGPRNSEIESIYDRIIALEDMDEGFVYKSFEAGHHLFNTYFRAPNPQDTAYRIHYINSHSELDMF